MIKNKIVLSCLLGFLGINALFAANEKGKDYYDGGMLATAKIYFNSQLSLLSGSDLAEAYYYLGEIYIDQEKIDSATYCMHKSVEAAADYPFGYVGQGDLMLRKNNKGEAESLFSKASKLDKKNSDVPVAIALAYAESKMFTEANEEIEKARKINKNNPRIYVAEGDIILMQDRTKVGDAAGKYENAIYFDEKCKEAYLKAARVFRMINIDVSLKMIDDVLKIDPDYIPAYLEMGETYYANGMYTKSAAGYKRYMEAPGVPEEYQEKYASALYVAKDYVAALEQANTTLAKNPKNTHMLRLEMFTYYDLKDYAKALTIGEKYFATAKPENIAWQDYRYYGLILKENKLDQQAIENFEKAIAKEPKQADLYKELATAYENKEDYQKAIPFYEKFVNTAPSVSLNDYLAYGRAYYMLGNNVTDTTNIDLKNSYYHKADSVFSYITEKAPQIYQGYWWRARANAALDPDTKTGLAKPYYEQTLEKIAASESSPTSVKLEACNYLGYYYYLQYDTAVRNKQKADIEPARASAIEYWQKVLELDPTSEGAKQALNVLKK